MKLPMLLGVVVIVLGFKYVRRRSGQLGAFRNSE